MLLSLLNFLLLVICVLVGVAFLTLFERSGLGYIQIRKGPNKVGIMGVLQPFADAISLFTSEGVFPAASNFIPYYLCPVLALTMSLGMWLVLPMPWGSVDFSLGWLFFLSFVAVSVYSVVGSGWFSNSKYALLGSLRAVAQTISYEVCLAVVIITLLMSIKSYDLGVLIQWHACAPLGLMFLPLSFLWLLIMMAETNRTPFDFAEGESELVSGFNIEYGGGGFALLFMAEYSSILFMSMVFVVMFLGGSWWSMGFLISLVSFLFIWIRGILPRYRYDSLMYLAWSSMLPITLNYMLFVFGLMMFI